MEDIILEENALAEELEAADNAARAPVEEANAAAEEANDAAEGGMDIVDIHIMVVFSISHS